MAHDVGITAAFEIEPPFAFHSEQHLKQILAEADDPRVKTIYDSSHFDLLHDVPLNVGQSIVTALDSIAQTQVIQSAHLDQPTCLGCPQVRLQMQVVAQRRSRPPRADL